MKARSRRVVSSASRSINSAAFVARASAADCPDVEPADPQVKSTVLLR
jgi:hypothetical protein